jgi:hypothetical protein
MVTHWPVAAAATMGLVYLWPRLFGGARPDVGHVARLEALATWTESLRDSIAGSVGLEEAIRHSLRSAPPVLRPALLRLESRMRVHIPLPQALAAYAEEFEDSSADLVIAALILNSRLRGPGLVATLTALSIAAREEVDMRRRVEEGRKSLRRIALIVVSVFGVFGVGLTVFSRDYVAPYDSAGGQVTLAVVLAIFGSGLMWMRTAAVGRSPERFLGGVEHVEQALRVEPVGSLSLPGGVR